jgi:hypothetical protein
MACRIGTNECSKEITFISRIIDVGLPARFYVRYRTHPTVRLIHITPMPRYSFTLEDGVPVAPEGATEDLADNQVAMDHAKLIAKDLARSRAALDHLRVVVRNEAGDEIGDAPLQVDPEWPR